MMNWLKNIWNAQRNAEKAEALNTSVQLQSDQLRQNFEKLVELKNRHTYEISKLTFERNQYSALTATLAAEYSQSLVLGTCLPDSIKEAHMLRGVATNWKYADDVKYGKGMFEKRERMEEKRKVMDAAAGIIYTPSAGVLSTMGVPISSDEHERLKREAEEDDRWMDELQAASPEQKNDLKDRRDVQLRQRHANNGVPGWVVCDTKEPR